MMGFSNRHKGADLTIESAPLITANLTVLGGEVL
jgi:hypothetical protein